jgi:hypothetical protein
MYVCMYICQVNTCWRGGWDVRVLDVVALLGAGLVRVRVNQCIKLRAYVLR